MKSSFFKVRKPKQFHFPTRYYDANKEERERRRKEIEREVKSGERSGFRGQIRDQWRSDHRQAQKTAAQRKFIIFLVLIAVLLYWLFFM